MAFAITSPAFAEGATVPTQFTCDGNDAPPPIKVSDPPPNTRSFAVIMDDPDAPKGTFTHWLTYDIPAATAELQSDAGKTLRNSFGREGYGGPCPPHGHGAHRYFFTVYAVDVPSLAVAGETRQDLERALEAHTLARAQLMGRYERSR
ncbi:MAG: YbhB/YbcL family Raf kinase inhibitor-like protein [Vicinamibacterales bacterium]